MPELHLPVSRQQPPLSPRPPAAAPPPLHQHQHQLPLPLPLPVPGDSASASPRSASPRSSAPPRPPSNGPPAPAVAPAPPQNGAPPPQTPSQPPPQFYTPQQIPPSSAAPNGPAPGPSNGMPSRPPQFVMPGAPASSAPSTPVQSSPVSYIPSGAPGRSNLPPGVPPRDGSPPQHDRGLAEELEKLRQEDAAKVLEARDARQRALMGTTDARESASLNENHALVTAVKDVNPYGASYGRVGAYWEEVLKRVKEEGVWPDKKVPFIKTRMEELLKLHRNPEYTDGEDPPDTAAAGSEYGYRRFADGKGFGLTESSFEHLVGMLNAIASKRDVASKDRISARKRKAMEMEAAGTMVDDRQQQQQQQQQHSQTSLPYPNRGTDVRILSVDDLSAFQPSARVVAVSPSASGAEPPNGVLTPAQKRRRGRPKGNVRDAGTTTELDPAVASASALLSMVHEQRTQTEVLREIVENQNIQLRELRSNQTLLLREIRDLLKATALPPPLPHPPPPLALPPPSSWQPPASQPPSLANGALPSLSPADGKAANGPAG